MRATFLMAALAACTAQAQSDWYPLTPLNKSNAPQSWRPSENTFLEALRRTSEMTGSEEAQRLVRGSGLSLVNLTWEDTGRYKGSSVGPNISDMTIQVRAYSQQSRGYEVRCMPVIRHDNFSDVTGDLDPEAFTLMVGNEHGRRLQRVSLADVLKSPTEFMTEPESWRGRNRSLWSPRDAKVLVSAQAAFLPIPKQGKATFNPVLFNYQSVSGDPAVLTILATREGTSMTVIDNKRDAFSEGGAWGQRLFHNQNGMRASLTGERLSDYLNHGGNGSPDEEAGLNMVLLIQVPLKQKNVHRGGFGGGGGVYEMAPSAGASAKAKRSDTENAVIGHGAFEGPFTEVDDLAIERDPRYPVRVTVQFYKATSTGVVSAQDVREIKGSIDRVYSLTENVGSLVTQGQTGRPTEYWGSKVQPAGWWEEFWRRHEMNTGDSRREAIAKLRRLLGDDYMSRPVCDLYLRDVLRRPSR